MRLIVEVFPCLAINSVRAVISVSVIGLPLTEPTTDAPLAGPKNIDNNKNALNNFFIFLFLPLIMFAIYAYAKLKSIGCISNIVTLYSIITTVFQ